MERVAGEAFYSPYHFHRLFVKLTGEGLAAYVRRLRLENSSVLLRSGRPVTETALASGYWTHEAFTRAFHRSFGRAPREFAAAPLPEAVSDCWLDRPRRVESVPIKGWRPENPRDLRQGDPAGIACKPLAAGGGAAPGHLLGRSVRDRPERIRYDAFSTVPEAPGRFRPGRRTADPAGGGEPSATTFTTSSGAHRRRTGTRGASSWVLHGPRGQLSLPALHGPPAVGPAHPPDASPYEEFVPGGFIISVPLE